MLAAVCSAVFATGTALQTFVIINVDLVMHAMQAAGASDATAQAPGFVAVLRAVGIAYLVGNALGVLALTGRAWVYWLVLAVNVTQAAGVVAGFVPPVVLQASIDLYGSGGCPSHARHRRRRRGVGARPARVRGALSRAVGPRWSAAVGRRGDVVPGSVARSHACRISNRGVFCN